jgi:hypothetical protein
MNEHTGVQVRLLGDGRIDLGSTGSYALQRDATWETLGTIHQGGQRMVFVRADIAGESWGALVKSEWLDQVAGTPLVTLARQSVPSQAPLRGWNHFY